MLSATWAQTGGSSRSGGVRRLRDCGRVFVVGASPRSPLACFSGERQPRTDWHANMRRQSNARKARARAIMAKLRNDKQMPPDVRARLMLKLRAAGSSAPDIQFAPPASPTMSYAPPTPTSLSYAPPASPTMSYSTPSMQYASDNRRLSEDYDGWGMSVYGDLGGWRERRARRRARRLARRRRRQDRRQGAGIAARGGLRRLRANRPFLFAGRKARLEARFARRDARLRARLQRRQQRQQARQQRRAARGSARAARGSAQPMDPIAAQQAQLPEMMEQGLPPEMMDQGLPPESALPDAGAGMDAGYEDDLGGGGMGDLPWGPIAIGVGLLVVVGVGLKVAGDKKKSASKRTPAARAATAAR